MLLAPGTRLGPYEIVAPLGAGGMGEVYRARDTKLGRDVAIKILPDAFVADPDRVARFQREAQLLATLNHPTIAAIYGLDETDGKTAIVLELVEGETLEARLNGLRTKGSRLPLDEALPIARQIAEALEAAHEKGVVHRDLKPANIKITANGAVKVLDFGLAKMVEPSGASGSAGLSMSPTLSVHATFAGVILGTAAYMSPEQARGRPVDKRTDIWAFGCVLFEMIAGRQTFELADGWHGDHHDCAPIFIYSRRPPGIDIGAWPLVTYVTDVEDAMRQAKQAAGDKDVLVHGAAVAQLALAADVLDELEIHLIPVLLGQGRRLFDHLAPQHIELERTRVLVGDGVTHMHYRVHR